MKNVELCTMPDSGESLKFKYLIAACVPVRFIMGYMLIAAGMDYLKASKFFVDAETIYNHYKDIGSLGNIFHLMPYDGFKNTAKLYRLMFFDQDMSFDVIIFLSAILYSILFICIINSIEVKYNKSVFIGFISIFVFDMIFLYQPSKDFISLAINLLVFKLIKSDRKIKDIFIIIPMILYALFFREYYFAILFLFYFLRLVFKAKKTMKIVILTIFTAAFYIIFTQTDYFEDIRLLRYYSSGYLGENTNTLIKDVFSITPGSKNFFEYMANYIIIALRLVFPVETLWKSITRGVFFFPLQIMVNYIVIKQFIMVSRMKKSEGSLPEDKLKEYRTVKNSLLYISAFFLTSVLFEPDFGSVFRHSLNIMPFVLYLSFSADLKHDLKNKFSMERVTI